MEWFWATVGLFAFSAFFQSGLIYLQHKNRSLSSWWGPRAFLIYNFLTLIPWAVFLLSYLILQTSQHPQLPWQSWNLQPVGLLLLICGAGLAAWVAKLFGLARLNGERHFRESEDEARIGAGPFRWMENPMYTGYFLMLLGIALWKNSWYDLVLALESLILLNFFQARIENLGLPKRT